MFMVRTRIHLKFIAGSVLLLAIFFSACSDDYKQEEEPKEDLTNTVPGRLEIPRLTGDTVTYKFIDHMVTYQGKTVHNYSMEYNLSLRHTRWVAFTACGLTAADQVTRTNAWDDDPQVPEDKRTERADYSGYDRGHLVASNYRRYCREAN